MIGAGTDGVRIWVATTPVDMRKSFDGLMEVARSFLGHDPLLGSMFVFRNRAGQPIEKGLPGPSLLAHVITSVLATLPTTPTAELNQFLPDVWKLEDAAEPMPDR